MTTDNIQSNATKINIPMPFTHDNEWSDWEEIIAKNPRSPRHIKNKLDKLIKDQVIMNKPAYSNEQLKKEIINIKIKLKQISIDIINLGLYVGAGFLAITLYLVFLTYKMYDPFSKRCSLL